jgi:hypothetical protein
MHVLLGDYFGWWVILCLRRLVLHRENIDISIDDLGNPSLKLSKNTGPHQEEEKKIKFFDKD